MKTSKDFPGRYRIDTIHEEDVYRVETLKAMSFDPYVMIYDKPNAPKETRWLQRYANNKYIFWAMTYEEYLKAKEKGEI